MELVDQVQSILNNTSPTSPNTNSGAYSLVDHVKSILGQNTSNTGSGSWDDFTQKAKQIAQENDFPASVLLGQASLESGHGTSSFAKGRNNYFGYQAYDSNPDQAKHYTSPEESIQDYINLIKNTPRYAPYYQQYLVNRDPYKLLEGIRAAGYATDPNYVQKVSNTPEFRSNLLN